MKITKKIAAVMAALMLISTCPAVQTDTPNTFSIECAAAESTLSAPANVSATVTDNSVTITWDKVKGAAAYRVYKYDAAKKKYVTYKTVKTTKIVIKDLEEGTSYKFKVAALTKKNKSYKAGKLSAAVTVSIAKPENTAPESTASENTASETEKTLKLKEVKLSAKEMAGAWTYYDFRCLKPYTAWKTYDPTKKEFIYDGWFSSLQFVNEKDVYVKYSDGYSENRNFNTNSRKIGETSYIVCSYGTDYFLFLDFKNGDGTNTYVFRKKTLPSFERVTDTTKLSGYWTTTDFCCFELNEKVTYDPTEPMFQSEYLYLFRANVTGKKITFYYTDGRQDTVNITKDKMGKSKYYVYSVGDDMYLYYQWINGDGDKQFYVLKKDK